MNEMITTILNYFAEWIRTQPVYIGGFSGEKEVLVLRDGEMKSAVEVYLDENKPTIIGGGGRRMTKKEAIKWINKNRPCISMTCNKENADNINIATDMAIEALENKRPHGEWIKGPEISRMMMGDNVLSIDYKDYTCSNCGLVLDRLLYHVDGSLFYKFCPECGTNMIKEEENGNT